MSDEPQDYFGCVRIHTRITDPQALWRKARDYLVGDVLGDDADIPEIIGPEDKPDVGACLIMLLDRSEFLDGAEIVESGYEGDTPDEGEE